MLGHPPCALTKVNGHLWPLISLHVAVDVLVKDPNRVSPLEATDKGYISKF